MSRSIRLRFGAAMCALVFVRCAAAESETAPTHEERGDAIQIWLTTADRKKELSREPDIFFDKNSKLAVDIVVDPEKRYQEMVGFGAAITDASAWLIQTRMKPAQRDALLRELFGRPDGLGLSFTRLTIGASDFSRTHYSFDDRPPGESDPQLAHFSIDPNRVDVLPVVKAALAINPQLRVMASPWSAPGWMKTSDSLIGGRLRPAAYAPFAEYLRRYVEAYAAEGVPIYALTLQNEPHFEPGDYPGMRLETAERAKVISDYVGPLFEKYHLKTRLLDWDHNWDEPDSPLQVLGDARARRYIAGVSWHCYAGDVSAQNKVHDAFPDKETYFTECSGGEWQTDKSDALLWPVRNLIIGATRAWAKGVLFWNLALDPHHGPHLGGCTDCRGVVTIDPATGEVGWNPEYYALAHVSRFVRPGALRIASSSGVKDFDNVAFRNADDGSIVLVVVNFGSQEKQFSVRSEQRRFFYAMPALSVATFVWRAKPLQEGVSE